jgi:hypothetical protein
MIKSNIKYLLIILLSTLSNAQNIENQQKYDSIKTISFSAVGDLMCHGTQLKYAKIDDNTFDFNPNYAAIKKYLSRTDFTIGNYETVTNKYKKYKGYPVFNTPPEYLEALKNAGFDFLTTTNNHATDGRKEGVLATIDLIDSLGLQYIGTFKSRKDRDSIRIYEKHDIKFSILSYSYGVNIDNLRADDNFMVNLIDTSLIKSDIQNVRKSGAEIVIVYLHLGQEYQRLPGNEQKRITNILLDYGVDVILSASPHVLQPIDFIENKNSNVDSTLVVYSMGNFISNQRWRYSDCGVIVNFDINKCLISGNLFLSNITYIPVWVYKGWVEGKQQYVIHPSEQSKYDIYPDYFSETDKLNMKQSFEDSDSLLTTFSKTPKLFKIFEPTVVKYDSIDAPIKPFDLGN